MTLIQQTSWAYLQLQAHATVATWQSQKCI